MGFNVRTKQAAAGGLAGLPARARQLRRQLVQQAMLTAVRRLGAWLKQKPPRTASLNRLLSLMYGQSMQVMPRGQSGLAGAVVFWYLQDGFKQFLMIRSATHDEAAPPPGEVDARSRFVSCLGQGQHVTLASALKSVMETQLGKVFVKTLGDQALAPDRVAAAPVFTYTDEATGTSSPVQALVWVVQLQAPQADLIEVAPGLAVVTVPEFALSSQKVSATHRALWQAVQRHIPKGRLARDPDETADPDTIQDLVTTAATPRVLH